MSADDDDIDSPLMAKPKQGSKEPLLAMDNNNQQASLQEDHSYTEFYARMGTQDEELTIGSGPTGNDRRSSASSSQDRESPMLVRDRDSNAQEAGDATTWNRAKCPSRMSLGLIATGLLLMIVLVWWISGGSKHVGPP